MNAQKARAIIAQALEDQATEGPMPEDDAKAIAKAQDLVEMAREAFERNVKGREVENIINLADSDIGENGDGPKASTAEKEQTHMEEPFEGYSALKVADIKEAIEGLLETEEMEDEDKIALLAETFEYESVTTTRASVLSAIDAAHEQLTGKPYAAPKDEEDSEPEEDETPVEPEPEDEPEGDESGFPAELVENEPWEGYGDMSVKEITDGLDLIVEDDDYTDDERRDVLMHVYAYESSSKRASKRIINKVEQLGKEKGYIEDDDADEEAAAPEADARGAGDEAEGPSGGEGDADGDDRAADAPSEQRAEAAEEDAEGGDDEAVAPAEARRERPADEDLSDFDQNYKDLMESVKERIDSERLHVPEKIKGTAPELPQDLTTLDNIALQKLHSAFTAYAYRIGYLRMLEEGYAKTAKMAADELTETLLSDWKPEKNETVTSIKAKIDQDENVKRLRRAQHKHEVFSSSYKMQQENYNGLLDRISRFWTMRREEWEMSGSKIGKAPSR